MSAVPRQLLFILCAALPACLAAGPRAASAATTIEVDDGYDSGTPGWQVDHFAKVQDGLDAASNGDTVLVHPGSYRERLDFGGKHVTLTSEDPTDQDTVDATILDGNDKGSVVTFDSSETNASVLTGFTIKNGKATYGAGVYVSGASPTITHNTFIDNNATFTSEGGQGGGIYCTGATTPVIASNTFTQNIATYWGGAICLVQSSGTISGNTIYGNQAPSGYGGAILLSDQCYPVIDSNTFNTNLAGIDGGGLWSGASSSPSVTGNTFDGNITQSGNGGAIALVGGSPTISGNTITGQHRLRLRRRHRRGGHDHSHHIGQHHHRQRHERLRPLGRRHLLPGHLARAPSPATSSATTAPSTTAAASTARTRR